MIVIKIKIMDMVIMVMIVIEMMSCLSIARKEMMEPNLIQDGKKACFKREQQIILMLMVSMMTMMLMLMEVTMRMMPMLMLMMPMKMMTMLTLAAAPPPMQTNLCNLLPPGSRSPSSLLSPDHGDHDHGGSDGDDHDHGGGDGYGDDTPLCSQLYSQ